MNFLLLNFVNLWKISLFLSIFLSIWFFIYLSLECPMNGEEYIKYGLYILFNYDSYHRSAFENSISMNILQKQLIAKNSIYHSKVLAIWFFNHSKRDFFLQKWCIETFFVTISIWKNNYSKLLGTFK